MLAIVTGGGSGLGYHIAKELRTRGYDLVIISRNEEKLKKASEELGGAEYHAIDLTGEFRKAGDIIREKKPDVLVNNAGFGLFGYFPEMNPERVVEMLNLNVVALTYLTRAALEVMQRGHILNIASVAACRPQAKLSAYAGSKAYVEHFTKSLAREVNPEVHVSYLLLGPTKTNFFRSASMPTGGLERIMLSPEKVAKYAVKKMLKGKERIVPGFIYKLYCLGK